MRHLAVVIFAVALVGCATDTLQTEFHAHPDYNVSLMKTYVWAEEPIAVIGLLTGANNIQLETRVRNGVGALMKSKGYRPARKGESHDMILSVLIGAIAQSTYSEHAFTSKRWAYESTVVWSQVNDNLRGAVAIIMTHPDNKDIMWQGSAGENLKNTSRNQGTIEKFTALIGEHMPTAPN